MKLTEHLISLDKNLPLVDDKSYSYEYGYITALEPFGSGYYKTVWQIVPSGKKVIGFPEDATEVS